MMLERTAALAHFSGVHLRHNNKSNLVFADGHVEREDAPYFLDIRNPNNWQHNYSKPSASVRPQLTGYRVYDANNHEVTR
jgi:prepilin-type processing-associated H-X9-DG protein